MKGKKDTLQQEELQSMAMWYGELSVISILNSITLIPAKEEHRPFHRTPIGIYVKVS